MTWNSSTNRSRAAVSGLGDVCHMCLGTGVVVNLGHRESRPGTWTDCPSARSLIWQAHSSRGSAQLAAALPLLAAARLAAAAQAACL